MLYRHLKTSQVKCNFCLEWMSLANDIKFNINICDNCLHKGRSQNALKAVSSTGEVYSLNLVNQTTFLGEIPTLRDLQSLVLDRQFVQLQDFHEKIQKEVQFKDEINLIKTDQMKDMMTKWSIISSFLKEKDCLSASQTRYLKILISQKAEDLKKLKKQLSPKLPSSQIESKPLQNFQPEQNFLKINLLKQNNFLQSVQKTLQGKLVNVKSRNKQNISKSPKFNPVKEKLNVPSIKEKMAFKSPTKTALKEKDLNCFMSAKHEILPLKENNYTSGKRLHTSFFDESSSFWQSDVKSSTLLGQVSSRLAFGSTLQNSATKRLNTQQLKKYEHTRSKIWKYLQKTYESQSLARLMFSIVFEAYQSTSIIGKGLELVSYNLRYTDFRCYLQAFDWTGIEILKLVNTKLSDQQLKTLIDFISEHELPIKVLVLTSNKLTQSSIELLDQLDLPSVKEIYLGKNRIVKGKIRPRLVALQNKYSLYL